MNIRLLPADDHRLMREGLRAIIEGRNGFEVVGEADSGRHLETQVRDCGAHVVIMDVAMPDLNGFEATRKILTLHPHVKVVALSAHTNPEFIREMLCAGASAYVLKERASEELIRAIREVMHGKRYLSPDIAGGVVDEYVELSGERAGHPAFVLLTDREREVLQQLAEGRATKEMADRHSSMLRRTIARASFNRSSAASRFDDSNAAATDASLMLARERDWTVVSCNPAAIWRLSPISAVSPFNRRCAKSSTAIRTTLPHPPNIERVMFLFFVFIGRALRNSMFALKPRTYRSRSRAAIVGLAEIEFGINPERGFVSG